ALKAEHQDWGDALDTCQTVDTSQGRLETRRLTASRALNAYIDWPGLQQVFEWKYTREHPRTRNVSTQTHYGLTSLDPERATAADLLRLKRGHWATENLSHRTRDVIFAEDASQVRCSNIPHVMAALRNTLLRISGHTQIAKALRFFAAHPWQALSIIQKQKLEAHVKNKCERKI
ncbi:MAG: hypothetical protein OXI24_02220, partial [Candidatus Poribacteria bacterium]|nr:hypothetical protein [Candidatus Poribacteria bacterium]